MINSKTLLIRGVIWNSIQLVVNQLFSFVIRLLLARILFPEQFGLIGMAVVFTGFIGVLNDLGMGAAIVQRKEEKLKEEHLHTAFWTGIAWSILLFIVISLVIGPLAAIFYNEPILKNLIPVLSIGILASPINLIHKAQLTKALDFKRIAFVENISNISAGSFSLLLAWLGAGVWSLAFNSVASLIVAMPLYFCVTKWRPRMIWDRECFKDIFGFGVYTTGTNIFNFFINNIDFLLIGKLLNAQALGIYTFAFMLTDTFRGKLMTVINTVMYPLYGKKQEDFPSLKRYYLKVVEYNSILVYPIMVCLFLFAEPLILSFFGQKWLMAIDPLKLLSIAVMVHLMVNSNTSLIRGIGKPNLEMKLQIIKAFIFIPMLFIGIHYNGIVGAAWAVLINKVIAVFIAQYTFNYLLHLKISTRDFLDALKVPWIASIVSYLFGLFFYSYIQLDYRIALLVLVISYGLMVWLLAGNEILMQIKEYRNNVNS